MLDTFRPMDVLVLIDKLDDLVHNAKAVPLTDQVRIDREEIYEILDQMRATIPEEIKQARWIVKERQEMLAEAKRECDRILGEAREQAVREASQTEIVKLAERQAQEIIDEARRSARETRLEMEDWADSILSTLEVNLDKFLGAVKRGRERLQSARRRLSWPASPLRAPTTTSRTSSADARRVAALYDVHGNPGALEAVLAEVGDATVVFGGDLAWGPMPAESRGSDPGARCPRNPWKRRPGPWRRLGRGQLGPERLTWLQSLPEQLELEIDGLRRVLFVHGSPRSDEEMLLRTASDERLRHDPRGRRGGRRGVRPHAHAIRPSLRQQARRQRRRRGSSVRRLRCALGRARAGCPSPARGLRRIAARRLGMAPGEGGPP